MGDLAQIINIAFKNVVIHVCTFWQYSIFALLYGKFIKELCIHGNVLGEKILKTTVRILLIITRADKR